jgi:hypothetical protein
VRSKETLKVQYSTKLKRRWETSKKVKKRQGLGDLKGKF